MNWQPIETAPESGYFLVHEDGAIRAAFRVNGKWSDIDYPMLVSDAWGDRLVGKDAERILRPMGFKLDVSRGCENPTHWMPLPEAP